MKLTVVFRHCCLVVSSLYLLCSCAGDPSGEGTTAAKTESGKAIVTASGDAINVAAHQKWKEAQGIFDQAEKKGWNGDACDDAFDGFEDASDAQGNKFAEARYMMGVVASRCGRKKEAEEHYQKALSINPKLCPARSAIGLQALKQNRLDSAKVTFEKAIKDDPQCTEAYLNLSIVLWRSSNGGEKSVIDNLRRALAIQSEYLPAFNQMALMYLQEAKRGNESRERLDLAEVVCRQAQLIDRNYAPIYNTWGLVQMEKGEIIKALRFFERAIKLDPKFFEARMNFGYVTSSFRGYADARDAYTKALQLKPRSYEATVALGAAYRGLDKPEKAKELYEKAMKLNPKRPESYFNLGILHQDYMSGSIDDLTKAKSFYQKFISIVSSRPEYKRIVTSIRRECAPQDRSSKRKRRRRRKCRPGRIQNIDTTIKALKQAQRIQQMSS